jgi:hypothetical protein
MSRFEAISLDIEGSRDELPLGLGVNSVTLSGVRSQFLRAFGSLFYAGQPGHLALAAPQYCFADTAGTIPAVLGGQVARVNSPVPGQPYLVQETAAARLTMGRHPSGGIRNLVNAGRTLGSTNLTQTLNAQTVNGEPYRRLTETTSLAAAGQRFAGESRTYNAGDVIVISARVIGAGRHVAFSVGNVAAATFNTTTGQVSATDGAGFIAAGVAPDGRFWIKGQFPTTAAYQNQYRLIQNPAVSFQQYDGDGTSGAFIGRIGIEMQAASAPHGPSPEQIRLSDFDITEAGIELPYYLQGDGVDDHMTTSETVNMSTLTKARLVAGLEKFTDVNAFYGVSHGLDASGGNLSIFKAATLPQWAARTRSFVGAGTSTSTVLSVPAPDRAVLTADVNRTTDFIQARYNNAPATASTVALAGNMRNDTLAVLAQPNGDLPMNGRWYGHAYADMTDADLARVQQYFASRLGETLT